VAEGCSSEGPRRYRRIDADDEHVPDDAPPSRPSEQVAGGDSTPVDIVEDGLVELGLIGRDVPTEMVKDRPLRVLGFVSMSAVEENRVTALSRGLPYGALTVALNVETDDGAVHGKAVLPIVHKDDFRAIYWLYEVTELPEGADIWVTCSPASGLLGAIKASLGIYLVSGDVSQKIKGPQERLNL
jgi:hypothetical protein